MARSKATAEMVEKMQLALFLEANANKKQPELLAVMLQKLVEADPESIDAELERIIDFIVGTMPEDKRQKFSRGVAGVRAAELREVARNFLLKEFALKE
jgi:hypothetical protein